MTCKRLSIKKGKEKGVKLFIFKPVSTVARMAGHRAASLPRKRERQDGDRSGHTGLSDSLIWDSDDMPSLQHPLSRALERYVGEKRANVKTDCTARFNVKEVKQKKQWDKNGHHLPKCILEILFKTFNIIYSIKVHATTTVACIQDATQASRGVA